jgi:tRNA dimethylallyltransferase
VFPVFVLFGPTASGKTGILYRLFSGPASLCPAEVVSADSMQVYRGMDIGTAKPSAAERAALPHHLIDIREPSEQFNVGDFVRLAGEACRDIYRRGKLPVVSGGTGFYLKNFIRGLPESPPSNPHIRAAVKADLAQKGAAALMEELAALDAESAARIHLNDTYRLTRALEVFRLTGRPLSSFRQNRTERKYSFFIAGLRREREDLYRRIDARTTEMFGRGLPAEVEALFNAGFSPADPGLRAIGYREFFTEERENGKVLRYFLRARAGNTQDLSAIEALVAQNSRRYAKRQITYFSSLHETVWVDSGNEEEAAEILRRELEKFIRTEVIS